MKITMKHFYDFGAAERSVGGKLDVNGWDVLRSQEGQGNDLFFLPDDRDKWQEKALKNEVCRRQASDIVQFIKGRFDRVNSYGVGGAFLEFHLKRSAPEIYLQCTDYAPQSVERLRKVFKEADNVFRFDMLKDPWEDHGPRCLTLFYRMDTSFDDPQWRGIFHELKKKHIDNILYVSSEFLTVKRWLSQNLKRQFSNLSRKPLTFAGYLRTRSRTMSLFEGSYDMKTVPVGDLQGYWLTLRSVNDQIN